MHNHVFSSAPVLRSSPACRIPGVSSRQHGLSGKHRVLVSLEARLRVGRAYKTLYPSPSHRNGTLSQHHYLRPCTRGSSLIFNRKQSVAARHEAPPDADDHTSRPDGEGKTEDPRRRSYASDELFERTLEQNESEEKEWEMVDEEAHPLPAPVDREKRRAWFWREETWRLNDNIGPFNVPRDAHTIKTPVQWRPDLYDGIDDYNKIRRWWLSHSPDLRLQMWPRIMLWYLAHRKDAAPAFLLASIAHPLPSADRVSTVLDMATRFVTRRSFGEDRLASLSTLRRICSIVIRKYGEGFPLNQHIIWKLVFYASSRQKHDLYQLLRSHNVKITSSSLLRFSFGFSLDGQYADLALDTLTEAMSDPELRADKETAQRVCRAVLRRSAEVGANHGVEVLSRLRDLGVSFNIDIYNALIANASDRGDYTRAWHLFNNLVDTDLLPDSTTYSTLLKMCRRSNDFAASRRLYDEIRDRFNDSTTFSISPILATEMIYSRWVWDTKDVEKMLKIYRKYFDLTPVSSLGLLRESNPTKVNQIQYGIPDNVVYRHDTLFHGPRFPPMTRTLALVLLGFLRRRELQLDFLQSVYANFKELIAARDPFVIRLAETNLVWDCFLKAFSRYADALPQLSEIMRDMSQAHRFVRSEPNPTTTGRDRTNPDLFEEPEGHQRLAANDYFPPAAEAKSPTYFTASSTPITPVKPTPQTWSILVNAYVHHDQLDAAEKILELMRANGCEPTIITWNSLIRGWSRLGDREKVVEGLENIEREGLQWDSRTVAAVQNTGHGERIGLGRRVKGGGIKTGPRTNTGAFEYVPDNDDQELAILAGERA